MVNSLRQLTVDDKSGALCPVLHPSRQDFERPFCDYVGKIFAKFPDLPMFKVVPPPGWRPRKKPFPDLADIKIQVPIRQHVFGTKGAYRCMFVEGKEMTVEDFKLTAAAEARRLHVGPQRPSGASVRSRNMVDHAPPTSDTASGASPASPAVLKHRCDATNKATTLGVTAASNDGVKSEEGEKKKAGGGPKGGGIVPPRPLTRGAAAVSRGKSFVQEPTKSDLEAALISRKRSRHSKAEEDGTAAQQGAATQQVEHAVDGGAENDAGVEPGLPARSAEAAIKNEEVDASIKPLRTSAAAEEMEREQGEEGKRNGSEEVERVDGEAKKEGPPCARGLLLVKAEAVLEDGGEDAGEETAEAMEVEVEGKEEENEKKGARPKFELKASFPPKAEEAQGKNELPDSRDSFGDIDAHVDASTVAHPVVEEVAKNEAAPASALEDNKLTDKGIGTAAASNGRGGRATKRGRGGAAAETKGAAAPVPAADADTVYSPPPGDAVDSNTERSFWANVTLNPPMYGADTVVSFFDEKLSYGWNLRNLGDLLHRHKVPSVPGVTSPMTYFGMWRSFFGWHKEDADLFSVNFLHWGAPKVWYCVSPSQQARFERMAQTMFPDLVRSCPAFIRHKDILLTPAVLRTFGVTFSTIQQNAGEFVVLNAAAYHAGFNSGFNCAEAVNFALKNWIPVGKQAVPCRCEALKDCVRISMTIFDPDYVDPYDETEDEEEGSEEAEESEEAEDRGGGVRRSLRRCAKAGAKAKTKAKINRSEDDEDDEDQHEGRSSAKRRRTSARGKDTRARGSRGAATVSSAATESIQLKAAGRRALPAAQERKPLRAAGAMRAAAPLETATTTRGRRGTSSSNPPLVAKAPAAAADASPSRARDEGGEATKTEKEKARAKGSTVPIIDDDKHEHAPEQRQRRPSLRRQAAEGAAEGPGEKGTRTMVRSSRRAAAAAVAAEVAAFVDPPLVTVGDDAKSEPRGADEERDNGKVEEGREKEKATSTVNGGPTVTTRRAALGTAAHANGEKEKGRGVNVAVAPPCSDETALDHLPARKTAGRKSRGPGTPKQLHENDHAFGVLAEVESVAAATADEDAKMKTPDSSSSAAGSDGTGGGEAQVVRKRPARNTATARRAGGAVVPTVEPSDVKCAGGKGETVRRGGRRPRTGAGAGEAAKQESREGKEDCLMAASEATDPVAAATVPTVKVDAVTEEVGAINGGAAVLSTCDLVAFIGNEEAAKDDYS